MFILEVVRLYYALVSFEKMPKIGFAHHFYAEKYGYTRTKLENSLEIVYVKEGDMEITLGEETMLAPAGSIFVLLRPLRFSMKTKEKCPHSHCTVQLISDFSMAVAKKKEDIPPEFEGLILPFVTPPGKTAETVKKQLYSIVSDLSVSRELSEFSASACAVGILEALHAKFRAEYLDDMHTSSILCYKIKKYISEHLSESLSLSDISDRLGKTSIYLNSVFKKETGTTICQYINGQKIRLIAELMHNKGLPFRFACESVGITDISYGYRLFKKQMGVTPGEYKVSRKENNPKENLFNGIDI